MPRGCAVKCGRQMRLIVISSPMCKDVVVLCSMFAGQNIDLLLTNEW